MMSCVNQALVFVVCKDESRFTTKMNNEYTMPRVYILWCPREKLRLNSVSKLFYFLLASHGGLVHAYNV